MKKSGEEKERDVERYFKERVKALGGETRKVKWIARHSAPDRFIMMPKYWGNFWAELKRPKKGAEEAQAREHARMQSYGETVVVLNSIAAIDEFFECFQ